jgi:hypothetical protein
LAHVHYFGLATLGAAERGSIAAGYEYGLINTHDFVPVEGNSQSIGE